MLPIFKQKMAMERAQPETSRALQLLFGVRGNFESLMRFRLGVWKP